MKLPIDKNGKKTLEEAINYWLEEDLIDADQAKQLQESYEVKGFDWRRLAQYSFWVAMTCIVLAFLSLFADRELMAIVGALYETPHILISLFCAALAALFYYLGYYSKKKNPEKRFSSESLMVLGIFATATSLGYLGKVLGKGSEIYSSLFLLSILIYAFIALKLHSKTIWAFMLIALGIWFATETAYHSNWGFRFWGMNYPLRFTLFGAILTIFTRFVQKNITILRPYQSLSYTIGLIYLFVSLWLLSIFGNYSDLDKWMAIKQFHILYWGMLSTLVSLFFAWYGLKQKDVVTREFGITFFFINLYTRYVEYLWDNVNRAIFFGILALSFWLIGRKAEKIWSGGFLK